MEPFSQLAGRMVSAMEAAARSLGAQGVIVVARLTSGRDEWESHMKVVDRVVLPGYNFLAIAYSKAAEMVDSQTHSGSLPDRPILQGEFGYPGGLIEAIPGGWLLTVFSGASGDLDTEIARRGQDAHGRG